MISVSRQTLCSHAIVAQLCMLPIYRSVALVFMQSMKWREFRHAALHDGNSLVWNIRCDIRSRQSTHILEVTMSLKSVFTLSAGALLLLAAPAFAASSWPSASLLSSGASDDCASASEAARESGHATDADLAKCTLAVKLAYQDRARAEALNNRSVLYYVRGEYGTALVDSTAALKLDDSMAEAIVNRGSIFLMQHRPEAAIANFNRALAFNPAHPEKVYFNRAMAREDAGDLNGAYADFAEAANRDPQWNEPRQQMNRFSITRQRPMS
jgi:tetratricopeptide (TPR) repeat protein